MQYVKLVPVIAVVILALAFGAAAEAEAPQGTASPCCIGRVGDVNLSGNDEPTIGDAMDISLFLFLDGETPVCLDEADINQSGGADPTEDDISIGDMSILIDYLFITGPSLGLPDCIAGGSQ